MAYRLPPSAAPTSLGPVWPLFGALFVILLLHAAFVPQILMSFIPLDLQAWVDERWNFVLLGILGAVVLAWTLLAARQAASAATGTGLLLAGYGLAARIYAEFLLWMLGSPLSTSLASTEVHTWARLVRLGGLGAYAFGITCTLAAVVAERRSRGLLRPSP